MATTRFGSDPDSTSGRAAQAGILVASTIIPQTFAPSLVPRSWTDQGIVTGLATSLDYLATVITGDVLDATASAVATRLPLSRSAAPDEQRRVAQLIVDSTVASAGVVAQRLLVRRPNEPVTRGLVRQATWRVTRTGAAALLLSAARCAAELLDRRVSGTGRIARFPVAIPAGLALAVVLDRIDQPQGGAQDRRVSPAPLPSLAASGAVIGVLGAVAALDHAAAQGAGRILARTLPGSASWWRMTGHAAFLGVLTVSAAALFDHVVHQLEAGATAFEPLLDESVDPRWIGPTVSGGPGSRVPWATLGREGRRHAAAHVRPEPVSDRPPGVPDLCIATIMRRPAQATPVQVYVGLDSAPDDRSRVELAMAELDRTGAWDRSVLMLISPTGTGYVNYCAVAAAQYLTLGDIATVTLQYSKRPSPLSLGRVGAAREQNRLLLLHVLDRLRGRPPGRRPRVVLFGESLGAHTSRTPRRPATPSPGRRAPAGRPGHRPVKSTARVARVCCARARRRS